MWWKGTPHVKNLIPEWKVWWQSESHVKNLSHSCESTKKPRNRGFFFTKIALGRCMKIKKLEEIFYAENAHLVEVLDKSKDGNWNETKIRGYGIVICEVEGLRFGIPLRSHIKHRDCFKTNGDKGLDFSKAVLLLKDEYISVNPYHIPGDEHTKIVDGAYQIEKKFSKYVRRYVEALIEKNDNVLKWYKFSTLQNYHAELIPADAEEPVDADLPDEAVAGEI